MSTRGEKVYTRKADDGRRYPKQGIGPLWEGDECQKPWVGVQNQVGLPMSLEDCLNPTSQ